MAGMTFGGRNWMQRYGLRSILSAIVVLFGIWQIVSPYILNFAADPTAMLNAVISGVFLVLFAALGFYGMGRWSYTTVRIFDGLAALTGLWLLISPFVLDQAYGPAFWNAVIVGLIAFICAGLAAFQQPSDTSVRA